jgi:hypothetical protein
MLISVILAAQYGILHTLKLSSLVFPVARHIRLPLLLEIYLSAILLSDAQRHRASTGCTVFYTSVRHQPSQTTSA